jgi:hypothetical protein
MGSASPSIFRHPVSDPVVPPTLDFQWAGALARAQDARDSAAEQARPAAASREESSELIDFQFQGLNARLEMEAVFAEGIIGG